MITITAAMMAVSEARQEDRFRVDLLAWFITEFDPPERVHAALAVQLDQAIADAQAFGLTRERSVSAYCVVAYHAGLEIAQDPLIRANLGSTLLSEDAKVLWLKEWMLALEAALGG